MSDQNDQENANGQQQDASQTADNQQPEVTWDGWLADQPDEVKGLIEGHTNGLKSALQNERDQRKALQKNLDEAIKKAGKGTETREALESLQTELDSSNQQLDFYEDVASQVTNVKLAWAAAKAFDAFDRTGRVNLEMLKAQAPELFKTEKSRSIPPGNGGHGAPGQGKTRPSMNDILRGKV